MHRGLFRRQTRAQIQALPQQEKWGVQRGGRQHQVLWQLFQQGLGAVQQALWC